VPWIKANRLVDQSKNQRAVDRLQAITEVCVR
jgi:hypothetical protein